MKVEQLLTLKPGGMVYYSLLQVPTKPRNALKLIYQFYYDIKQIAYRCSDRGVARVKLHWWHDEVNRLFQMVPQHPLTRQLLSAISNYNLTSNLFRAIIGSTLQQLDHDHHHSLDEFKAFCQREHGPLIQLCNQVISKGKPMQAATVEELAFILHSLQVLQILHFDRERDRFYLPLSLLPEASTVEQLFAEPDQLQMLGEQLFAELSTAKDRFFNSLTPDIRKLQRFHIVLLELNLVLASELQASGFDCLTRFTSITPIRNFFLARKFAKREQRYAKQLHRIA